MKNLFAYTAPGCNYPEFISVNREVNQTEVIVRSAAWGDGTCGNTASIKLTPEQVTEPIESLRRP